MARRFLVLVSAGALALAVVSAARSDSGHTLNLTEWCPSDSGVQSYGANASLSGFAPFAPFSGTLSFAGSVSVSVTDTTDADGNFGGSGLAQPDPVPAVTLDVTYAGGELTKTLAWPCQKTMTAVRCSAGSVVAGGSVDCAAVVSDPPTSAQRTPKGTVRFAGGGAGRFHPSSCALAGSGPTASCSVTFSPAAAGWTRTVSARYLGEHLHRRSAGAARLTVRKPPLPARKAQCRHGGWRRWARFRNQRACVTFVVGRRSRRR